MAIKLGYATSVFEGAAALLESNHVGMDMIMCLLGPRISSGNFRDVYEHTMDPTKVIKIEYGHKQVMNQDAIMQNSFCNVQEYLLWAEIEGLKGNLEWVKKHFAPVRWISPGGHVLCMDRTWPEQEKQRPDTLPAFLWDVKPDNFGWIGDDFVCHDYAHVHAFTGYGKKMRNVKKIWQ